MERVNKRHGFSLMELIVVVAIFSIVSIAGHMVIMSAQTAWSVVDTQITLQQSLRQATQIIGAELKESGWDENGVLQVDILDNAGSNNTDILRFAVPICACGIGVINQDGDVTSWGAPIRWGDAGCNSQFTLNPQGKVDICHLPPGNPNNTQSISVAESAVNAHLAHGDWLGDCGVCDPTNYTNRWIEYRVDTNGQLVRRVLTSTFGLINEIVIADNFIDFQVSQASGSNVVSVTYNLSRMTTKRKTITLLDDHDVFLKN